MQQIKETVNDMLVFGRRAKIENGEIFDEIYP